MTTQLHLSLGLTPEQVLADSEQRHGPFVARYALISGGRDSSVLAHACRHAYEAAAFIDTGTALPGVREHVERLASWLDKPLVILETPRSEYDRLVVGSTQTRSGGRPDVAAGFPGPPLHGSC